MTDRPKPKVGDRLFWLNVGNSARHRAQELTPTTVTKVGRKYFCVEIHKQDIGFYLSTWVEKTDYSTRYQLYLTEQEWLDDREKVAIIAHLRKLFEYYRVPKLTLAQLRRIKAILDEQ